MFSLSVKKFKDQQQPSRCIYTCIDAAFAVGKTRWEILRKKGVYVNSNTNFSGLSN